MPTADSDSATSANDDSSTRLKRGRDSELDTTASIGRIDWTSNGGLTVAMRALIAPAMASVGSDERTISEGANTSGCWAGGTNTAGAAGSATELSRTSPLTPMMVLTGPNSWSSNSTSLRPTGSSPGSYREENALLTMTTPERGTFESLNCSSVNRSASVKSRPRNMGMPMARK